MTLGEVLLHETNVLDFVLMKDGGWTIGCTIIDDEDLFISSLNTNMLNREVKDYYYKRNGLPFIKDRQVMIVEL